MTLSVIIYIILMVILWMFWILYRGVLSLQLLIMGFIIPVVLFGILLIQKYLIRVKIKRNFSEAVKGEPFQWVVLIQNPVPFPVVNAVLQFEYQNSLERVPQKMTIRVPLYACNMQRILLDFHALTSGVMELKLVSMRIYDPLRLFSLCIRNQVSDQILIMPDCAEEQIETWEPTEEAAEDATEYSKTKPGDDPSEVFEIHEYHEGDAVSRIHWKLSSKLDELMVKEYSLPIHADTMILPDYRLLAMLANGAARMDMVLCLTYAISNRFRNEGRTHSIIWYQQKAGIYTVCPLDEPEDTELLIRQMLQSQPSQQPLSAALDALDSDIHCTQLILLLPKLTEDNLKLLPAFAEHRQLTVFYMLADGEEPPQHDAAGYELIGIRIAKTELKQANVALEKGDDLLCVEPD